MIILLLNSKTVGYIVADICDFYPFSQSPQARPHFSLGFYVNHEIMPHNLTYEFNPLLHISSFLATPTPKPTTAQPQHLQLFKLVPNDKFKIPIAFHCSSTVTSSSDRSNFDGKIMCVMKLDFLTLSLI
jgi:hypothetical protein